MSLRNFPGPYEVELAYAITIGAQTLQHKQRLNCDVDVEPDVGDGFNTFNFKIRSGGVVNAQTAVDNWILLLVDFFDAGDASFATATLFKYVALSDVKNFKSVYDISEAGVAAGAAQAARQDTITFHTAEGNEMRLQFMETNLTATGRDFAPISEVLIKDVADFVIGTSNWILARDTSYPRAVHAHNQRVNSALFTRRHY